jgi:starch synthase
MEIIHVSAECYPVAKAGGLGDVVGALPQYQNNLGHIAKVVMPMYRTKFLYDNQWEVTHKGGASLGSSWFEYTIIKEKTNKLGFDLYLVDINGLLDREKIYSYDDDTERFTSFQIAVVDWLASWKHQPDVIHVHDYHTAFIPFMLKYCYQYQHMADIPTVLTIHNAQYQGWMGWDKSHYIPHWDSWKAGMLEWKGMINPLACGVKCAFKVTTVSQTYMEELRYMSNGLEALFEYERGKCIGILNGIDTKVWDPEQDTYLENHFSAKDIEAGKMASKKILCDTFHLDITKPLIVFIGRLVGEKAADLLPQVIGDSIYFINGKMNFLILGSGDFWVERQLEIMRGYLKGIYNAQIGYNEKLSHLMYAGADFLLMPSRVEPCGLNQMYSMRYGTIPIVRQTGGLQDTVVDYNDENGYGVCFTHASVGDITHAIYRSTLLYDDIEKMTAIRKQIMELDFSWDKSAEQYIDVYKSIMVPESNSVPEKNTVPESTIMEESKIAPGRNFVPESNIMEESNMVPGSTIIEDSNVVPENNIVEEINMVPGSTIIEESNVEPVSNIMEESNMVPGSIIIKDSNVVPEINLGEESNMIPENILEAGDEKQVVEDKA